MPIPPYSGPAAMKVAASESTGLRLGKVLSRLAQASAWLMAGTVAGGLLGYLFQILMGRLLSTPEYGLLSAMMALFAVLSAPLGTLLMVISRQVSTYRATGDAGSVRHFYFSVNLRTLLVGTLLVAAGAFFVPQVQGYFKAPSPVPVWLLGALLFVTFLPTINDGFLQGLQKFEWLSASSTLRTLLKIVFATTLVLMGFGVSGALGGTLLATLVAWAITYAPLHGVMAAARGQPHAARHLALKPAVPVLLANTAFAAMTQLDMVLVNYYFPPHEAGLYAAASILGKAVMYLPGGIAMALFPMVAENHARDKSSARLFLQAVALTAVLCAIGAVAYFLLADWIVAFLYGERFAGAGDVLRWFGIAIMPMALVMVAEYFLIAKGRVVFAYLFMVVAPLQVLAIHFFHDSLLTVVAIMAVSGTLLAAVGYAIMGFALVKERR